MFNQKEQLTSLKVGRAKAFGGLAVFPLIQRTARERDYLTFGEAFRCKGIRITEISDHGSVPELRVRNLMRDKSIFGADGEALLGAKQNRILNTSVFIRAGDEVIVPVSCVERGRWRYDRPDFKESDYSEFVASRAAKMDSVSMSLKRGPGDRRSDQGEVWEKVAEKGRDFGAYSATESMADIYAARQPNLDQYVRCFRVQPNQIGLSCAIDGRVVGMEIFEEPTVFSQHNAKLIRAYAAEVLDREILATEIPDRWTVRRLLQRVVKWEADEYSAVGSGTEFRFYGDGFTGSGLVADHRLIHLVMFRNEQSRPDRRLLA